MTATTQPTDIPVRASYPVAHLARLNADKTETIRRLCAELEAVATICEDALGDWIAVEPPYVPERLQALRNIYDHATEALADPGAIKPVTVEPETNTELRQVVSDAMDRHELIDNGVERDASGYFWS